ncbi:MAG: hypothetical protein M3096_01130 [Actinomycetia bacterium]|nr:hypothetical protein [Actinomycetes bacterium]
MNDRNEALDRLRSTNPVPTGDIIDPDEISTVVALCEGRRLTPEHGSIYEPPRAPRRNTLRPALAFAAAFTAVIVAAGLFALLGRGGEPVVSEPPSTTLPMTTTTAPSPATTVAADPWGNAFVWIEDTAVDSEGSIWAATNGGLVRWLPDADEPVVYTTDDGLPSTSVQSIAIGPDDTVWIGGYDWIARFYGSKELDWSVYPAEHSIGPITVASDGAVWTVAGLDLFLRFDGSDWETLTVPDVPGNDDPWSRSLAVAPDGTVWAGANDHRGVVSYDGSDFTYYEMWDGQPDQSAATVAVAPDGTVWIGGDIAGDDPGTGVASFDGTNWTQYTTEDGLLSDSARIAIGPDGTVWAVHYGPGDSGASGASRFDGSSWMASPVVAALGFPAAVDADGTLWAPASDHASIIGFSGESTTILDLPTLEAVTSNVIPDPPTPQPPTPRPAARVGEWNPVLAERHAGPTPLAAACPTGDNPNQTGPASQERPQPGQYSNQAADFDRVWGRIVYVDIRRHTWTLDVCTNTWHEMNADGVLPGTGSVVYDVDSDRTVLFGHDRLWVYDRERNSWEWRSAPQSDSYGWASIAAFYDPLSGLIITARTAEQEGDGWHSFFSTYDVDTDEWSILGTVASDSMVIGYSHEADRVVTARVFSDFGTDLLDPRTGALEFVEQAHPVFIGGFGYSELANGADTAYAMAVEQPMNAFCGFDSSALGWSVECWPVVPQRGHAGIPPFDAITYDWLNGRILFIGGVDQPFAEGDITSFDDVWSLDPETGEWLELLPPSNSGS